MGYWEPQQRGKADTLPKKEDITSALETGHWIWIHRPLACPALIPPSSGRNTWFSFEESPPSQVWWSWLHLLPEHLWARKPGRVSINEWCAVGGEMWVRWGLWEHFEGKQWGLGQEGGREGFLLETKHYEAEWWWCSLQPMSTSTGHMALTYLGLSVRKSATVF